MKVEEMYEQIANAIYARIAPFDVNENQTFWDDCVPFFNDYLIFINMKIPNSDGCRFQSEPEISELEIWRPKRESGADDIILKPKEISIVEKRLWELLQKDWDYASYY